MTKGSTKADLSRSPRDGSPVGQTSLPDGAESGPAPDSASPADAREGSGRTINYFDAVALANAATRKLCAYDPGHDLPALRKRFGSALAELGSNENPLGPSPLALAAEIQAALPEVLRYPDPKGGALKSALATHLGVSPAQITLGNGSHELLMLIAQTFADASASIVFSEFGFAVFPIATAASGAQAIRVPALPRDHAAMPLGHELDAMAAAVRADTRLLYLANPNNPTGTWFDDSALERLLARVPASTLVVVDEAYHEYVDAAGLSGALQFLPRFPNLVVTRTFSKAYALAGLRVGYAISAEVAAVLERLRESFNVNGLALAAAEAALGQRRRRDQRRAEVRRHRADRAVPNERGEIECSVGDVVKVALDAIEDGFGETRLSREKAKRSMVWDELEEALEKNDTITGKISGKVKGGFTVDIKDVRAFLPGSLVDVRPVRDPVYLEGKELEFKLIKLDRKRNNVVVRRRAVVESEHSEEREQLLETPAGRCGASRVSSRTSPITAHSWTWAASTACCTSPTWPGSACAIRPKSSTSATSSTSACCKYRPRAQPRFAGPQAAGRRSVGQHRAPLPGQHPRVRQGLQRHRLRCFVEIEPGVEGLVHVSEMDWTNKNVNPSKVVQVGDEVEVMVLDVDEERRRISLGIKQTHANPWEAFAAIHKKGDKVSGQIKSITDFGIFIGLDGGIDGLVHLSDISWQSTAKTSFATSRRATRSTRWCWRSIRSASASPWASSSWSRIRSASTWRRNPRGASSTARSRKSTPRARRSSWPTASKAICARRDIAKERVEDATQHLKVGDKVEAKFIGMDRKGRVLQLSIRAKDDAEMQKCWRNTSPRPRGTTKLGALLQEQLNKSE